MSDLWSYKPEKCDGDYCPMDCDKCPKAEEDEEHIDGLHGAPNSTRLILYRNHYNEHGLLINMEAVEERKTGRWIHEDFFAKPICSSCGKSCFGLHAFDYQLTSYCPHCGARMEDEPCKK